MLLLLVEAALGAEPESVTDESYRVRLALPGPGWVLYDGAQIHSFVPDAIVGACSPTGRTCGAVIAEELHHDELASFTDLIVSSSPALDKEVEQRKRLRFAGQKAERYTMHGGIDGVPFVYMNTTFLYQGHGYQVLCWAPEGDREAFGLASAAFFEAFSLLPGEVGPRNTTHPVEDAGGPGWEVRGGVYTSAASGLRVAPPPGWSLALGGQLDQMNRNAEVGLTLRSPEVYVAIFSEYAAPEEYADVEALLWSPAVLGLDVNEAAAPIPALVDGRSVSFRRTLPDPTSGSEVIQGVFADHHRMYRILAWGAAGGGDAWIDAFGGALSAISVLPPTGRPSLAPVDVAALASEVGPDFSYRGGVYRSFREGLAWVSPREPLKVEVGEAARLAEPAAILVLDDPVTGLTSELLDCGATPWREWHASRVGEVFSGMNVAATPLTVAGREALVSEGAIPSGALLLRRRLVTFAGEAGCLQADSYLWDSAATASPGALGYLEAGLQPSGTSASTWDGTKLTDERLGFRLTLSEPGWKLQDSTPEGISAKGRVAVLAGPGGAAIAVAVIDSTPEGQGEKQLMELSLRGMSQRMGEGGAELVRTEGTLAGRPAAVVRRAQGYEAEARLTTDRTTIYGLIVTGTAPGVAERVFAGFEILP